MSDKIKRLKEEMIIIYGGRCWINKWYFGNKLTYHHILERRNGGKAVWDNGALLLRASHDYLNYLDNNYHKLYNELNGLFYDLNRTFAPPTEEYYEEVERVLKKVRK